MQTVFGRFPRDAAGAGIAIAAAMFQVNIADHVRLSYESLEAACEAHTNAAARLSRLTLWFRGLTLAAAGAAAIVALMALQGQRGWQIAATFTAAAAFAMCGAYVGFDQQPRMHGHRASAARLWLVCEKYRALLAEMHDGLIDLPTLGARRNALLQEAATIFEQTAPADRYTFEIARRALKGYAAMTGPAAAPTTPVETA